MDNEIIYLSEEELINYQLEKLNETINHSKNSAFYSKKLKDFTIKLDKIEDIKTLPITEKIELQECGLFDRLAVSKDEMDEYHESFGTTGMPIPTIATKEDLNQWGSQMAQCGVNFCSSDILINRFPYAISSPAHIIQNGAKKHGVCVIPASSRTAITPHVRIINLLKKMEATIISCMPLEAIMLGETAKIMGYDPKTDFPHLRAFCTAGEMLTDRRKKFIENMWNVKVYNMYGSTETGNLACSCEKGKLHLSSDHFYIEVLDPITREAVKLGEKGELVVTTLTVKGSPLVRYATGDIVSLDKANSCSCGRNGVIINYFGRKQQLLNVNNKVIYPADLQEVIYEELIDYMETFWMVGVTNENITIRYESKTLDGPILCIAKRIEDKLGCKIILEPTKIGEIFNRDKLIEVEQVKKPNYIVNWDDNSPKITSLDELLSGYYTFKKA